MSARLLTLWIVVIGGSLFFLLSSLHAASEGKIQGHILDSQSSEPLPGANVYIEGTNYGAATDLNGRFVISSIPPGNYKLVVRYIGYGEKTFDVTVEADETLEQEIKLDFQSVQGEVVEVTAQAEGQMAAINQQLSSNTISNVVSKARIKELPDVNAAESIGRLPGVAIQRSGGEASKVIIRGLSPKYNIITVNGVRVPAVGDDRGVSFANSSITRSGGDDRSVDLTLISSNMLDGIEVKKAVTPDMDADVLGGTVDLRLKEAPQGLLVNASAQTGYNKLQNDYGNYNFAGTLSNRFLNNRLGVIANFNTDDYDRSADKLQGDYGQVQGASAIEIESLNLREETVTRGRTGGSALFDYVIPKGKITGNTFYSRLHWDGLYRTNRMAVQSFTGDVSNRHYYDIEDRGGATSIFTGGVGIEQDFDWLKYDLGVARTASRTNNPNERTWHFVQENNGFDFSQIEITPDTPPTLIPTLATNDTFGTALADLWVYDTKRDENQTSFQLNLQMPFHLSRHINGYFKTGGKLRWLDRMNDEERNGRNGLHYGNGNGPNTILTVLDRGIPEWGVEELVDEHGLLPISLFLDNYSRSNFLAGDYPLGFTVQGSMLERTTQVLSDSGEFRRSSIASIGRDYKGEERYQAGYIMGEFNFGKHITLLPGIRYERDESTYDGQRFREVVLNNIEGQPAELAPLTKKRENDFWLPMVHLQIRPTDWLKIRLARTQTISRPDFILYAPITRANSNNSEINAANSALKPSKSTNLDASVSVYENHVGLFTVSGFRKDIDDLIFYVRYRLEPGIPILPSAEALNIPTGRDLDGDGQPDESNWLKGASPYLNTYINNPDDAWYRGVELDWQTHFWYLPSILKGLVFNINYTYIQSEVEKRVYYTEKTIVPIPFPHFEYNITDSTRSTRLQDQPTHIANITLGYDYKGFSARLSYLYQTDRVTSIDDRPVLDTFSGPYARWDLTLQQRLGRSGIQLFANLANLNARPDKNFRGGTLEDPSYIEYYGFTLDIGARYRF